MFSVSDAYLRSGEDWIPIKRMAKGGDSGSLGEEAWPVLLGLAVVSSGSTPIGMNGKRLRELAAQEEEKRGLDQPSGGFLE
jgi:hypothetical protein